MIERVRQRKEEHKLRGRLYRIAFAVGGGFLILLGLFLAAPGVPGPGLLVIGLGLAMLALEFDWAERWLERVLDRVERVTETSRARQVALVVGGAIVGATMLAAAWVWDVPVLPV